MANSYFRFTQFTIHQDRCAMKVCTDSCLFGAWVARHLPSCDALLDVGAGTGLLMMMLAQQFPARIDGIEIDPACFEQLKENIGQNDWKNRLHAYLGDVRDFKFPQRYPVIVSNPPFYEKLLHSGTHQNRLARHSVSLSLNEFFEAIRNNLESQGQAFIIVPFYRREEAVSTAMEYSLHVSRTLVVRQTEKHAPFRVFYQFSSEVPEHPAHEEITIRVNGNYSPEFSQLLRPYYLAL